MEDPDTVVAIRNRAFASVIPRQIRSFKLSLVGGNYMRTSMLLYYFAITILSSCIAQTPVLNENNQSVQAKVIDRLKQENVTEQFNLDQTVWHQNSSSDQEKRNITRIGQAISILIQFSRSSSDTWDTYRRKCDICDKKFIYRCALLDHGSDEKFKCDICNIECKYLRNLRTHMKDVHMDKKELKCDECNKIFKRSYALRRHKTMKHNVILKHSMKLFEYGMMHVVKDNEFIVSARLSLTKHEIVKCIDKCLGLAKNHGIETTENLAVIF
ncbi:hypothetical protein DINM_005910 [Dirofilaria immitis]|nr:hypothetical protein [Dirofilaria immitis]